MHAALRRIGHLALFVAQAAIFAAALSAICLAVFVFGAN